MKKHADNTLIPEESKFGIEEKFYKVDDTEELVDELETNLMRSPTRAFLLS